MGSGGYDVFLSYARSDGAAAAELNGWLNEQGLSTFFDRSALRPGLRWVPALEDAIGRSKAVAILVGAHGLGNTQQYERELALIRQTGEPRLPGHPGADAGMRFAADRVFAASDLGRSQQGEERP